VTLKEFSKQVDKLMKNPNNHNKELIGDVKPGEKVISIKVYSMFHIAIYDEREKSE